ncbi:MAG TPA: type IV pilus twitching motility protein PilT [Candidatus Dormibacteraeota bacterium]|nr:type IV pilus twitching motility protein PilT [Candidatus Dormibacteraeota bacterium]
MLIDKFLEILTAQYGSDLLIQSGGVPVIRVDGALRRLDHPTLTNAETRNMLAELVTPSQLRTLEDERQLDFAVTWRDGVRLRGNAFYQRETVSVALRMLPREIPSFTDLHMPEVVNDFVALPRGLLLVTGPTGSGKSTTLAAMVDRINHDRGCHIITIEDPIEYVHSNDRSVIEQREVGRDAATFSAALRAAFREDPDVVLIGEMRDHDTISSAITIAETGHLVLATLHTNDSSQTIDRIVDVFPGSEQQQVRTQLANCLAGAIYQQLLPAMGGGRVAAFEILVASSAVRNLVKEGKTNQIRNVLQTSAQDGMQTLERSLSGLVQEGLVTLDQARARSMFPDEIT